MVAYEDHHGNKHFDICVLQKYEDKALSLEQVKEFAEGIQVDTSYGGLFHVMDGKFTHPLVVAFIGEGNE